MTVPVWVLLLFAGWTVATLMATGGVYRWSRILSGRAALSDFPADALHGSDWYRRAVRAHANCVENLPLYAAIVVAIAASGVHSRNARYTRHRAVGRAHPADGDAHLRRADQHRHRHPLRLLLHPDRVHGRNGNRDRAARRRNSLTP